MARRTRKPKTSQKLKVTWSRSIGKPETRVIESSNHKVDINGRILEFFLHGVFVMGVNYAEISSIEVVSE